MAAMTSTVFPTQPQPCVTRRIAGREWRLQRPADLETLWQAMDADQPGAEDHIPYWAEVWPAGLALADWLAAHGPQVAGRTCLDLGCGLGLTALVGAWVGARVVAVDLEAEPLAYARRNAAEAGVDGVVWLRMDWRRPCFRPGAFQCIWGGDILYEARFFAPLAELFGRALAPGGWVVLGEARRSVSAPAWDFFASQGWRCEPVEERRLDFEEKTARVTLWRLTRKE